MNFDVFYSHAVIIILIGFILDLLFGDPYCLPHPIRLFGQMISFMEKKLNKGSNLKLKGAFMWVCLVFSVGLVFLLIEKILNPYPIIYCLFGGVFFFYGISNRSLVSEVLKVENKLIKNDLECAKKQLSMIVGRDTKLLNPAQIRTALLETLSENLSDGVIAPSFFFAIGGIPLMMAYKMVNTLDSMVGYKNERFMDFGFFSAKMDDVANYIPARITALLMALISLQPRTFKFIFKYRRKHSSPNSGYPEAALAGILDCRLGGPNLYKGIMVYKPFIGNNDREIYHKDIVKACIVNMITTMLFFVFLVITFYNVIT